LPIRFWDTASCHHSRAHSCAAHPQTGGPVAELNPQVPASPSISSDSRGCGGGILTCLQTGAFQFAPRHMQSLYDQDSVAPYQAGLSNSSSGLLSKVPGRVTDGPDWGLPWTSTVPSGKFRHITLQQPTAAFVSVLIHNCHSVIPLHTVRVTSSIVTLPNNKYGPAWREWRLR
jgi:hypothetical protein